MELAYLEQLERIAQTYAHNPDGVLAEQIALLTNVPEERCAEAERLIVDGQFFVLLGIKRAEWQLLTARELLTPDTEYLREELNEKIREVQILVGKIDREESLRRDREALLSEPADPEEGIDTWISSKTTRCG